MTGSPPASRRRIGLIVPSNNAVIEPEFALGLPPTHTVHAARITATGTDRPALLRMAAHAVGAAELLAVTGCDVLLYACLSTSAALGVGHERELVRDIERAAGGVPCRTALDATVQVLRRAGKARPCVISVYLPPVADALTEALRQLGMEVTTHASLSRASMDDVAATPVAELIALALASFDPASSDAVHLAGTDLDATAAAVELRRRHGVAAFSTNEALLHAALAATEQEGARPGLLDDVTEGPSRE